MMGRVRDISTNQYHIFVNQNRYKLENQLTYKSVQKKLKQNIINSVMDIHPLIHYDLVDSHDI